MTEEMTIGEAIAALIIAGVVLLVLIRLIKTVAAFVEGLGGQTNPRDDDETGE